MILEDLRRGELAGRKGIFQHCKDGLVTSSCCISLLRMPARNTWLLQSEALCAAVATELSLTPPSVSSGLRRTLEHLTQEKGRLSLSLSCEELHSLAKFNVPDQKEA